MSKYNKYRRKDSAKNKNNIKINIKIKVILNRVLLFEKKEIKYLIVALSKINLFIDK